jgi:hypothetical protein
MENAIFFAAAEFPLEREGNIPADPSVSGTVTCGQTKINEALDAEKRVVFRLSN